jgi:hypothetical protein
VQVQEASEKSESEKKYDPKQAAPGDKEEQSKLKFPAEVGDPLFVTFEAIVRL